MLECLRSLWMYSSHPPLGCKMAGNDTPQDSLDITGCCFAPHSPGDTSLQHSQSPDCTGRLLRDLLIVITTGLASAATVIL